MDTGINQFPPCQPSSLVQPVSLQTLQWAAEVTDTRRDLSKAVSKVGSKSTGFLFFRGLAHVHLDALCLQLGNIPLSPGKHQVTFQTSFSELRSHTGFPNSPLAAHPSFSEAARNPRLLLCAQQWETAVGCSYPIALTPERMRVLLLSFTENGCFVALLHA